MSVDKLEGLRRRERAKRQFRDDWPDALAARLSGLIMGPAHGKAIARHLGVHPTLIIHWTSGRRIPNIKRLVQLANITGASLDWLCGREDAPAPPPLRWVDDRAEYDEMVSAVKSARVTAESALALHARLDKMARGRRRGRLSADAG